MRDTRGCIIPLRAWNDLWHPGYYLIVTKIFSFFAAKPSKPVLTLPDNAIAFLGDSYTMTCESDGLPEPSYKIFLHNDTKVVSTIKTYNIPVVQYHDAGTYKCVATNSLGSSSTFDDLKVKGKIKF